MTAQDIIRNVKDKLGLDNMNQAEKVVTSVMGSLSYRLKDMKIDEVKKELLDQLPSKIDEMMTKFGIQNTFSSFWGGTKSKFSGKYKFVDMVKTVLENYQLEDVDPIQAIEAVLREIKSYLGSDEYDILSNLSGDLADFWEKS